MAFMVYEHTPGAERETTIDFEAQTARVDIAPGQWATVPFLEKAEVQPDGTFAFKIEQGGLIRNYVGKVEENGNVEGKMTFTGGMEGVVVEFSTESRPGRSTAACPAGGPPPGGPGMPPPGGPGGPGTPLPSGKISGKVSGQTPGHFLLHMDGKTGKFP